MEKERIREIITQLKTVRVEKGYSYQKIADMTEKVGEPVSLSTVRRVFTEDAHTFRWDTIKPIATVLLGVGFETPKPDKEDPEQGERYYAVIEGLKAVVEAKGELIDSKERSIEYLKTDLRRSRRLNIILGVTLALTLIIIIVALIVDRANPDVGFFWRDTISAIFGHKQTAGNFFGTTNL